MTNAAPNLLAFDTSTEQLSVAVQRGRDGQRFAHTGAGGAQASTTLIPTVQALLAQAGLALGDLRQYAMSPFMQLGGRLVYFLVALSLLAAAVNAIVLSQRSTAEPGPAETAPARQGAAERPAGAGTPSDVSGAAPA